MVTRARIDRIDQRLDAALTVEWTARLTRAAAWVRTVDVADPLGDDAAEVMADILEATADPTGVKLAGLNPERRAKIIDAGVGLREILGRVKAREILRAEAAERPTVGRIARWA